MYPVNNDDQTLARINDVITKSSAGVILLPTNPTADAVAAGTALYLSLLKLGKTISLVCSSPVNYELVGADKIENTIALSGDNLVVSFPYTDGAVDKVDYNIQGNNFNLIITPRAGFPKLNKNQVKYSYTGGSFDFIVVIDASNLNSLGEIYTTNPSQFQGKDIINVDRHLTNNQYGTINFVDKTISSVSELIFKIIDNLKIEIDKDIATNLYFGISSSTNNFSSYSVNANTFEVAAALLRLGAVKKMFKKPSIPTTSQAGSFKPSIHPTKIKETQQTKSIEVLEKEPISDEKLVTPQDWLKPKIFKGGGLI